MKYQSQIALFILVLTPLCVQAHAVDMDWKQVGGKIEVEAFFDDDTPALEARVQILDDQKTVLASAVTDAKGRCVLIAPNPGKYRLVLDAGAGHRKERSITIVASEPVADAEATSRRADFTRIPWERALIGLGVIALVGAAWWWSRRG